MKTTFLALCASVLMLAAPAAAAEKPADKAAAQKPAAYAPMVPFAKLAGKAWRGEGTGPDGEPIIDIARYEMILGGRAFQSTHKLENASYGGRTIIFYDEGAKTYVFHYFTTAGFHTIGEIVPTETGFTAVEAVQNHPEYAEVRSVAIFGDGTIEVRSQHVTHDGEVSDGDGLFYREIADPGPLIFDEGDTVFGKRSDVKDAHDRHANEQ